MYESKQPTPKISIKFKSIVTKKSPRKSKIAKPKDACIVFGNDDKRFPIDYLYTILLNN